MAVVFSDDFNRADGSPGANWTGYFSTWAIASNQVTVSTGATPTGNQLEYTGSGSSLADCSVAVKHISTASNPGGVTARRASGVDTHYIWRVYTDGGWELCRKITGSITVVLNDGGTKLTLVSGAIIKLTVTGSGATVTLDMNYNGVAVTTYNDTDGSRITVAGVSGIYGHVDGTIFDDFVLDDLTVGGNDLSTVVGRALGRGASPISA